MLSRFFYRLGRLWQSFWMNILKRFVDAASQDPALHLEVGELLENQGRLDESLKYYTQAIQFAPELARAYSARARLRVKLDELDLALTDASKAIDLDSSDDLAFYVQALCLVHVKRHKEAKNCLEQAIELNPSCELYHSAWKDMGARVENS